MPPIFPADRMTALDQLIDVHRCRQKLQKGPVFPTAVYRKDCGRKMTLLNGLQYVTLATNDVTSGTL